MHSPAVMERVMYMKETETPATPETSADEVLLAGILDLLKNK